MPVFFWEKELPQSTVLTVFLWKLSICRHLNFFVFPSLFVTAIYGFNPFRLKTVNLSAPELSSFFLPFFQIGDVSDEELLDLLNLAMSSDAATIVRRARELLSSKVDPLQLLAQLANLIMDVLAGNHPSDSSEARRVTGKHTCMLSFLSLKVMYLHIKCPQILYAVVNKLCRSARYCINLLNTLAVLLEIRLCFFH